MRQELLDERKEMGIRCQAHRRTHRADRIEKICTRETQFLQRLGDAPLRSNDLPADTPAVVALKLEYRAVSLNLSPNVGKFPQTTPTSPATVRFETAGSSSSVCQITRQTED